MGEWAGPVKGNSVTSSLLQNISEASVLWPGLQVEVFLGSGRQDFLGGLGRIPVGPLLPKFRATMTGGPGCGLPPQW